MEKGKKQINKDAKKEKTTKTATLISGFDSLILEV
jgi:hypothetical protein